MAPVCSLHIDTLSKFSLSCYNLFKATAGRGCVGFVRLFVFSKRDWKSISLLRPCKTTPDVNIDLFFSSFFMLPNTSSCVLSCLTQRTINHKLWLFLRKKSSSLLLLRVIRSPPNPSIRSFWSTWVPRDTYTCNRNKRVNPFPGGKENAKIGHENSEDDESFVTLIEC